MADVSMGERIVLNYQDYCALPNDGRRYEILDGELVVSPSPKTRRQRIAFKLGKLLSDHVQQLQLGEVFVANDRATAKAQLTKRREMLATRHAPPPAPLDAA